MKYCNECKLHVLNDATYCPLCTSSLEDQGGVPCKNTYPVIAESFYSYNFILRLVIFLSLVIATSCVVIDFFTIPEGLSWSIIVLSGIVYLWVTVAFSLRSNSNFAFRYSAQIVSISAVLYIIDYYSGYTKWSINYSIPFFLMLATFAITFLILIKRVRGHDYLFSQLVIGLFGLVPLIFMPLNLLDVVWPTVISAAYSFLTLAGTIIFNDRFVRHELKKKFHI